MKVFELRIVLFLKKFNKTVAFEKCLMFRNIFGIWEGNRHHSMLTQNYQKYIGWTKANKTKNKSPAQGCEINKEVIDVAVLGLLTVVPITEHCHSGGPRPQPTYPAYEASPI